MGLDIIEMIDHLETIPTHHTRTRLQDIIHLAKLITKSMAIIIIHNNHHMIATTQINIHRTRNRATIRITGAITITGILDTIIIPSTQRDRLRQISAQINQALTILSFKLTIMLQTVLYTLAMRQIINNILPAQIPRTLEMPQLTHTLQVILLQIVLLFRRLTYRITLRTQIILLPSLLTPQIVPKPTPHIPPIMYLLTIHIRQITHLHTHPITKKIIQTHQDLTKVNIRIKIIANTTQTVVRLHTLVKVQITPITPRNNTLETHIPQMHQRRINMIIKLTILKIIILQMCVRICLISHQSKLRII